VSGLLRNCIAFVIGLFAWRSRAAGDVTVATFWVTPFDAGLRVLKSDKVLQVAETAQLDYLLQTGTLFAVLRSGAGFVNLAQQVKFSRPVPVFSRVRVDTRLLFADAKCAWFSHVLHAGGAPAAEVLVKMKFKKGRVTVPPSAFLACSFASMPPQVARWEPALDAS
jgi:acyl-CoA thioesterase FadM